MTLIKIAPSQTASGATSEGITPEAARRQMDPARAFLQQEQMLRNAEALAKGQAASNNTGLDLRLVIYPQVPHAPGEAYDEKKPERDYYGSSHAVHTFKMANHVSIWMHDAKFMGAEAFKPRDYAAIKAAALLHDLGRTEPWQRSEPKHNLRSAQMAEKALKVMPEFKDMGADFAQDVCRLILAHELPPPGSPIDGGRPRDPRLIALWDAECYESMRFAPNTPEAGARVKACLARTITAWAGLLEHQRRYRSTRGWT